LLYFSKWKRIIDELGEQHAAFCEYLDKSFAPFRDIESQQEFAKKVINLLPNRFLTKFLQMVTVDPSLKIILFDWRKEPGRPCAERYCARLEKKSFRKNLQHYLLIKSKQ